MTREEIVILRMNILGGMDAYIRNVIGNDYITERWNIYGVPDGADEEELTEIAEDGGEWARICAYFGGLVVNW